MRTYTTAQMSSTSASTLADPTNANAIRACTLLMADAEVIMDCWPQAVQAQDRRGNMRG